jgi:hypothetical protein
MDLQAISLAAALSVGSEIAAGFGNTIGQGRGEKARLGAIRAILEAIPLNSASKPSAGTAASLSVHWLVCLPVCKVLRERRQPVRHSSGVRHDYGL